MCYNYQKVSAIWQLECISVMINNNTEYVGNSEAREKVENAGKSMTTFYRHVREGKIEVQGSGHKRLYKKSDLDAFIQGNLSSGKRPNASSLRGSTLSLITKNLVVGQLNQDNLLYAFVLQYEQNGYKEATPMETMWSWIREGASFWCLYNAENPKDIVALLGILPLTEEQILRLLRQEISLQDIQPANIRPSSHTYYIISAAKPENVDSLSRLMEHMLSYWCEKDISASAVYTEVQESMHENPLIYMVKEKFFAPRPDIGQSVWCLAFVNYNPSPAIQQYKKCIQDNKEGKNTVVALPMETSTRTRSEKIRVRNLSGFRPLNSDGFITKTAQFRRAVSTEDIRSILRINATLFGTSTRSEDELIKVRQSWLSKNPEIYHVLEVDGKIVGFLSMFPLPLKVITSLISGEISVSQIRTEDILPYEPNNPVDIFVQTLGLEPTIEQQSEELFKRYGSFLIKGLMNLFYLWGSRGVEIQTVYARSDTPYGIYTSRGLGFKAIPSPPGVHKQIFRLNVARSEQAFLMEYMNELKNYWKTRALQK